MRSLKNNILIKSLIYITVFYPLYFISYFIPRKKNLWLFGNHNNIFSDNSKYLFYYIADNHKEIKAVWVSNKVEIINMLKEKGYNAVKKWSLKGIWICLRAKVYIFNFYISDINFWTSGGTLKINLWHGIPLKKIEYSIKVGKLAKKYNSKLTPLYKFFQPHNFKKPDYFLSTSPLTTEIFSEAFRIKQDQCIEFGYPRCQHFFWSKEKILNFIKEKSPEILPMLDKINKYKKIIIYMPTFRENTTNDLNKIIDIELLNNKMVENNYLFIIKQHPNIKYHAYKKYSNVIFLPNSFDVYLILPFTDILVTDFSSVMFDYMLLKKPIIFFIYDYDEYLKNERGVYSDINKFKIGFLVRNIEELINALIKDNNLSCDYKNIDLFFKENINSCELIYNKINKVLK